MATTPSKRPPSLPLVGTASPGDYLLQEEALPTPPRLSQMLEDLESQAASELELRDATLVPSGPAKATRRGRRRLWKKKRGTT